MGFAPLNDVIRGVSTACRILHGAEYVNILSRSAASQTNEVD